MKKICNRYMHERLHKEYQLYNNITNNNKLRYDRSTHDIGCQFDSKSGDMICTCKNNSSKRYHNVKYFGGFPKQVYAYHKTNITDIGVSNIKTVQKKKVKKIYLPETNNRGVGSSDLSSFIVARKPRYTRISYYDHKKTSSKCIGGVRQSTVECVISAKLSPFVHMNSASAGPKAEDKASVMKNIEIKSNSLKRTAVTTTTQVENEHIKLETIVPNISHSESPTKKTFNSKLLEKKSKETVTTPNIKKIRMPFNKNVTDAAEKVFSSDSLVQHVHNLENPCEDKPSRTSLDPMENKLEREYRRMFSTKSKDTQLIGDQSSPELNSASLLRHRFEALRHGLAQKDDSKKNAVLINIELSRTTTPSKRDVSIASDPPSLEARSYSYTKANSPYEAFHDQDSGRNTKYVVNKKERGSVTWSRTGEADEGVKGMFKLWEKKFDFEEENYRHTSPTFSYVKAPKNVHKEPETWVTPKIDTNSKKGKKFFFFRKKSKDKSKPYKPKKGVTAGRCEVKDGLVIKIGKSNDCSVHDTATKKEQEKPNCGNISDEYDGILRKAWLKKFLEQTIESKNSVQIRWNNRTYATSSSTVFEIMDDVYKQTEVALKSKSETSTGGSSFYQSFKKQRVNFVQDIEAWMIPRLIRERPKELPINVFNNNDQKHNIKINNTHRNCFIDKSKAFANQIEVVLHSKNFINCTKKSSSEYIRIHIPKGFFSDSVNISDKRAEMSNSEEVYNIVEYETPESDTRFQINKALYTGDSLKNDINITISVKDNNLESKILETDITNPTLRRDVVIQGSNVCDPRLCDVIGVEIITQRDIRDIRKPILKIQYDYSEESDFEHTLRSNQKTCEFAESYLQDFYRHWTPPGMEVYSGCVSDSHLQGCSDTSQTYINNQGDGTKSCPNICDDYQGSTIVSSCTTSSCSHCDAINDRCQQPSKSKFLDKFKRKSKSEPNGSNIRVLPKDSLEVFKKRKLYACSNKSKWFYADNRPYSITSTADECEDTLAKSKTEYNESKKPCKKHVSLPGCDVINDLLAKQMSGDVSGILVFKGAGKCETCKNKDDYAKHTQLISPPSELPQPPCKASCEKKLKPECSKPNQPSCNVSKLSYNVPCTPPGGSPPCQKSCPPTPPPCYDPIHDFSNNELPPRPLTPSEFPKLPATPPMNSICFKPLTPPPCSLPSSHLPPHLTPISPCLSPPLCTASPPCGSPKKGSLESLKNLFKKKSRDGALPPSCCRQPSTLLTPKVTKKTGEAKSTSFPLPSSKSSQQTMQKSSCDCTKDQFTCQIKKQISKHSLGASCNNRPQEKSLQGISEHSQMDCQTPEMPIYDKPIPKPKYGLHLKKLPSCPPPIKIESCAPCSKKGSLADSFPSRLSDENIRIRVKKTTPSTEEIREGLNIKVQDADGRTLYERRDYTTQRSSIMEEMYNVHRISTPRVQNVHLDETNNVKEVEAKSEASLANQIEIHVKLKLTPGNKTTEVKMNNEGEIELEKPEIENDIRQTSENIFMIKETGQTIFENLEGRNDINIKIVLKNFKPKSKKEQVTDFSKKISNKFHSVSTGYSVVDDQIFSLHETKMEVKSSEEIMTQEFTEKHTMSIESIQNIGEPTTEDITIGKDTINIERESKILNAEDMSKFNTQNETKTKEMQEQKSKVPICATDEDEEENTQNEIKQLQEENSEAPMCAMDEDERKNTYKEIKTTDIQEQKCEVPKCATDEDEPPNTLEVISDDSNDFNSTENIPKPCTKKEKKEMLKKVFEKAADLKKGKLRNRMPILRKMLKSILTSDSSDRDEIPATSNDLANDITYASLKPNYFRDTDSMNNYYNDSIMNSDEERKEKPTYPTEEQSAESKESDSSECCQPQGNCVCSTFAQRLNLDKITGGGCCCRSVLPTKVDEETCCDLRNEIDLLLLNYKIAEHCDVQIQNSIKTITAMNGESIAEVKLSKMSKVMDDMSKKSHTICNDDKNEVKNKIQRRTFLPNVRHAKEYATRRLNKNTMLGISDEDKIYVLNNNKNREKRSRKETVYCTTAADILQSYETKKAVLEIYAEKAFSENGEHIVAKLPKFVYDKERQIEKNYRKIVAKYNTVSDKDIVL